MFLVQLLIIIIEKNKERYNKELFVGFLNYVYMRILFIKFIDII